MNIHIKAGYTPGSTRRGAQDPDAGPQCPPREVAEGHEGWAVHSSGLHLPFWQPESGKCRFGGRKSSFAARMRTNSEWDSSIVQWSSPGPKANVPSHLQIFLTDLKNKFNSRAVLLVFFFSTSLSAAEILWFVLTLKIQNKICANDIPLSQLVLATLLLLHRTSASTNANTRTLLRAECPTFQWNHSNYKPCNKTVSALNE